MKPDDCYFLDHKGQRHPVFLRKVKSSQGVVQTTPAEKSYEGAVTVSKIFWSTPFVLGGKTHASVCEACANRFACWQHNNKNNRRNCMNWLASPICGACTHYKICYPMKKAVCKRCAPMNEEYGFIISQPVKVPTIKISDLKTSFDLAMAVGRKNRLITWMLRRLAHKDPTLYHSWFVPKRNGTGQREITAPNSALKWLQKAILEHVLYQVPAHPASVGFEPGISIRENAERHSGKDIVISLDLKDFFPSIGFPRVFGALKSVGLDTKVAGIITAISTWKGALPQGAPTSPRLSNMVTYRLDKKLQSYLGRQKWTYTRYADDITFSFSRADNPNYVLGAVDGIISVVKRIVAEEGFQVNEAKTKIMRRGRRQWVTGLVANEKPNISRQKFRRVRAAIHNAKVLGIPAAAKKAGVSPKRFTGWVSGNLAFFQMVNPERTNRMKTQWEVLLI